MTVLFLAWVNHTIAQLFVWKPSIGINYLDPNLRNISDKPSKIGFDCGLYTELAISKNKAVELGIFYSKYHGKNQRGFIYPTNYPFLDAPRVNEQFNFNCLKIPLSIIFKQPNENPYFLSLGLFAKFNISANRTVTVTNRPESYADSFKVDTRNGGNVGLGFQLGIGKGFAVKKQRFSVRLNSNFDITQWRYPTNFYLEDHKYYAMRNLSANLLVSYIFK